MSRYDLWTHGVNTVVEFPDRAVDIRHAGWGTLVEQEAGGPSDNWFHIPLPTPTVLDSDTEVALVNVAIRADANENARIRQIDVRELGDLVHRADVDLAGPNIQHTLHIGGEFNAPLLASGAAPRQINFALAVCMRVDFLTGVPTGRIIFRGAGARFDE